MLYNRTLLSCLSIPYIMAFICCKFNFWIECQKDVPKRLRTRGMMQIWWAGFVCWKFQFLFQGKEVFVVIYFINGLPWWLSGKESTCRCRRCGFDPWVRKIPSRMKWRPIPVFLPWKCRGQRRLMSYSLWCWERVRHDLVINNNSPTISCRDDPMKASRNRKCS